MSIIFWFIGSIILFFFCRGIIFYQSFFSITKHAYYIANIEGIKDSLKSRIIELFVILISSPMIGITVMNPANANEMMLNAFKNVASKFSNKENARNFLQAAEELWEKELAKEKL